jgi:aryl sulfotransferase
MNETIVWPTKTRELHNHHFDSTIWNDFRFRDDDIVISTYAKSGTTWTQQIVAQLLFGPDPNLEVARCPPGSTCASPQGGKTADGGGADALAVPQDASSPRRPRLHPKGEVHLHWARRARRRVEHVQHANANQLWYEAVNDAPGRVGPPVEPPPGDVRQYFRDWLEGDGYPFHSFWENVRTWWELRDLPNVLFVHFANLKRDMPGQMRRIAQFLDIPIDETQWEMILEYCSFDWMKRNATKSVPLGGAFWDAGAQVFINRGVNGRWAETLTPEDVAEYEERAVQELGPECARWLATGEGLLLGSG